jgi:hypothetical protein
VEIVPFVFVLHFDYDVAIELILRQQIDPVGLVVLVGCIATAFQNRLDVISSRNNSDRKPSSTPKLALLRSRRLIAQSKLTSFSSATGISPSKNLLTGVLIFVRCYDIQTGLGNQGQDYF